MKLLFRLSLRKIKKSLGRFLSILLIVALGVGFFAGLRESAPDILTTLDNYYDNTNLMDFKITSTTELFLRCLSVRRSYSRSCFT